jgi:hypothetical protein
VANKRERGEEWGALYLLYRHTSSGPSFPAAAPGAFRLQLAALMLTCGFVLALATLIFKISLQGKLWTTMFWLFAAKRSSASRCC